MLQPGDQIDIWVVEKALGSGGMGSVYRCHNRKATRILAAVKVLESNLRKYPEAEARFIREAEILFQLDHPNIVKVRNVRTDIDPPYLEMEFVSGESLEERLRRGALPYAEAIQYMQQMASAMAYLHQKGVRHRDIKPANLLVTTDNKMKLVDFGLAMEADTTRITQQGMTFGTVSYAPPEWIAPDTLDPAKWDLYAIGVVFYEMLTGKVAFPVSGQGSARQQAMQVIVGKQGHAPLDPGEQFHDDVRSLIRDMTMSDASTRVGTAAEAVRRTRKLVRSLRHDAGVTLAPAEDELAATWDDNLDQTPPGPAGRADTWMGNDLDAVDLQPPKLSNAPTAPAAKTRVASSEPTSPPTITAFRSGVALMVLGLVGMTAVAIAVGAYAVQSNLVTAPRPVDVVITGLTAESPLSIRVGGLEPTSTDGSIFRFENVPVGATQAVSLLGERCQTPACPGPDCPTWCAIDEHAIEVYSGSTTQTITLQLTAPKLRRVEIELPKIDGVWPLDFKLGGKSGSLDDDAIVFEPLSPGNYTLTAHVGTCEPADLGCWQDKSCEPGCHSFRGKLVIPLGDGKFTWDLPMPSPERVEVAVVAPKPRPAAAAPKPSPAPTQGHIVMTSEFARWLASHPQWQQQAAIAEGRAKTGYLRNWDGATPPKGTQNRAMLDISWYAANAFCNTRGGLAEVDAEPQRWTEAVNAPYIELRQASGKGAWHSSDGRSSTKIVLNDSSPLTGVRCKR